MNAYEALSHRVYHAGPDGREVAHCADRATAHALAEVLSASHDARAAYGMGELLAAAQRIDMALRKLEEA